MSTMREVAALAGVSGKTVSRVMRNDRYVSDEVRKRVESAIAELQYVPNVLARTFRSGSDNAIGVAVPDISDPFFAAVIHPGNSSRKVTDGSHWESRPLHELRSLLGADWARYEGW